MSIEDFNMQTFLRALTGGVQDLEYIRFRNIEVDFDGQDMSQEIAVEVTVGHQSDTVPVEVKFKGEHEIDVTLSHAQILESLGELDEVALFTGSVLGELDHEQAIQAVHAIAAWRMSLTEGDDNENSISQHRRWEHIHTAINLPAVRRQVLRRRAVLARMEVPEPEPEPEPEPVDVPDPDDATFGAMPPGNWDTLGHARAANPDIPKGLKTVGRTYSDVGEWGSDDATAATAATADDLSSARSLAMAMIRNDHQRPLLIGLLVEAGYAVGKKVS